MVRRGPGASSAVDLLLEGLATRFTSGYSAAVQPLRNALDAVAKQGGTDAGSIRWLWLACRVAPELWDDRVWDQLTARAVSFARDSASLTMLPIALTYRAGVHVHAGEFAAAAALIEEAQGLTEATREPPLLYTSLVLPAWRGREREALETIDNRIRDANTRGEGRVIALAECCRAVLFNGLGHYQSALPAAQRACESDDLALRGWALIELIEAAARNDARSLASDALGQLDARTRVADTDWALGILARSRALLCEGEGADRLYREAIERLGRTRIAVHLARAHLVYGEWLRREHRRVDAREQLRAAHEMFTRMGAEGFAERARRELLATGETVRKRSVETLDELTAQEAQIARLAADGQSNPEIAAELFISPRTVEYHLRKVFAKLDITSRKELSGAFRDPKHLALAG
jgi:DNA-binding CsgD family transcriptional regulator